MLFNLGSLANAQLSHVIGCIYYRIIILKLYHIIIGLYYNIIIFYFIKEAIEENKIPLQVIKQIKKKTKSDISTTVVDNFINKV